MENKKTNKKGLSAGAVVGIGATVAALGAAAYVLFGPEGKKNKKIIRGWAVKMKGEIIEKLEEAKETILKLAEVSSKATAKVSAAKKQSSLVPAKSTRTEKLPNYSDPSERPNTTITNRDIGWFD